MLYLSTAPVATLRRPHTDHTVDLAYTADASVVLTPIDRLIPHPENNWVTVSLPSGDVMTCEPDGSFGVRPAGAAGSYQVATQDGRYLWFKPLRDVPGPQESFAYLLVDRPV